MQTGGNRLASSLAFRMGLLPGRQVQQNQGRQARQPHRAGQDTELHERQQLGGPFSSEAC